MEPGSDYHGLVRKMGLEPTRHGCHKILSLARLPIPTLPHFLIRVFSTCLLTTSDIILFYAPKVNYYFKKIIIFIKQHYPNIVFPLYTNQNGFSCK